METDGDLEACSTEVPSGSVLMLQRDTLPLRDVKTKATRRQHCANSRSASRRTQTRANVAGWAECRKLPSVAIAAASRAFSEPLYI